MTINPPKRANPAEEAAQRALGEVYECIQEHKNFRFESGAGSGKTYSLIKALRYIIEMQGKKLLRRNQRVACISYTNVATDEITSRIDGHPAVYSSTIHSFCWSLIKGFQPFLRRKLSEVKGWPDRIKEAGGIDQMQVEYEIGHRHISTESSIAFLGHNDVLTLMVFLMEKPKFRKIFTSRYPILLIDEYQDTNKAFAESITEYFIKSGEGPLIGLFGDSWQKIYGDGCGLIEHERLMNIGNEANFRSVKTIIDVLNKMRPELPQEVKDLDSVGSVIVYHSNDWKGTRRSDGRWKGDLPVSVAHKYLEGVRKVLEEHGWDFLPEKTKILMLTHKVLASEQNYRGIADAFRYSESYIKKEDPHIAFLVDTIEPMCIAYQSGWYGDMFSVPGVGSLRIKSLDEKREWANDMDNLLKVRETGTIGQVIDYLEKVKCPSLPDAVSETEMELTNASPDEIRASLNLTQINNLRDVSYQELIALTQYISEYTPFSTKHGVKGVEYENVLVVLGRGWNFYNWNQFLEWTQLGIPNSKISSYERNRNLFYVSCSRSMKRLALLFTQELSDTAMQTLANWFGEENIHHFTT